MSTWTVQFDQGYISPYLVTNTERMEASLEDPYILIPRRRSPLSPTFCRSWRRSFRCKKPLLIIADDMDGEALATLVVNKLRGTLTHSP